MSGYPVVLLDAIECAAGGKFTLHIPHLEIAKSERVAIVGHNGAGKSTLFRLLTGFARPSAGHAHVLAHALHGNSSATEMRSLRCDVGQIMQGLHLVQRLTVIENVLIGSLGRVHGWRSWTRWYPEPEIAAAEQALSAVGLADKRGTRTDQLSGGERQKAAIARLLLQRPQLILADEPTAALDPSAAREICQLITNAAKNATLISVVHNPALLPLLADRVIGLKGGRVSFDLPLASVDVQRLEVLYQMEQSTHPPANVRNINSALKRA